MNVDRERVGRGLPPCLVGILQKVQRRLDRQLFALDDEAEARHRLVEEPVPGGPAGDALLMEELLDAVLQLVGLLLADVLEPRPVMAERGIAHGDVEHGVVDPVQLQRKEKQVRAGIGDLLLDVAIELRADGIAGVAGMEQAGIGDDPPEQLLQRLEGR